INVVLIVVLVPLLLVLTRHFGPVGAAMAWFGLHTIYLVVGTAVTHRFLLRGLARRWLTTDVAIPMLTALAVIGAGARASEGGGGRRARGGGGGAGFGGGRRVAGGAPGPPARARGAGFSVMSDVVLAMRWSPSPPRTGSTVIASHTLPRLAERHRLHLVCAEKPESTEGADLFASVRWLEGGVRWRPIFTRMLMVVGVAGRVPGLLS